MIWPLFFLGSATVLCIAVFFHELGHLIYFILHTDFKNVEIRLFSDVKPNKHPLTTLRLVVGTPEVYELLTDQQRLNIYWWGIVAGTVPPWLSLFFCWWYALLFLPYMLACKKDILLAFEIMSTK